MFLDGEKLEEEINNFNKIMYELINEKKLKTDELFNFLYNRDVVNSDEIPE